MSFVDSFWIMVILQNQLCSDITRVVRISDSLATPLFTCVQRCYPASIVHCTTREPFPHALRKQRARHQFWCPTLVHSYLAPLHQQNRLRPHFHLMASCWSADRSHKGLMQAYACPKLGPKRVIFSRSPPAKAESQFSPLSHSPVRRTTSHTSFTDSALRLPPTQATGSLDKKSDLKQPGSWEEF